MGPTTVTRSTALQPWLVAVIGALLAAAMVFLSTPGAFASAPDTPGGDQEATDFYFGGVITFEDEPVPDVTVTVEGDGFEAETVTDAEGQWRLYVPEKEQLHAHGRRVDPARGRDRRRASPPRRRWSSGSPSSKIVNLFLGEGERVTQSFFDQLVERLINGLNFGLLLALAAIGVSLIFGTTGLSNFAHGEMVTFGAHRGARLSAFWRAGRCGSAIIVVGDHGRRARAGRSTPACGDRCDEEGSGVVQLMIVSIGLSLALRYTFQFFIGGGTYQLPGASPAPTSSSARSRSRTSTSISMGIEHRRDPRASPTGCCAPASARRRARSPTTRSWPRHPASTSTASSGSSGSSPARSPPSPASCGPTSAPASSGTWARRCCC